MLNVAMDPWLPAILKDGSKKDIAPWQIGSAVKLDAPRAPWNGALTEFLISLFQTMLLPEDAAEWRRFWEDPPSEEYLKRELSKAQLLFTLRGRLPFLQDGSIEHEKFERPIGKLLLDGISDNQEKKNSALFTRKVDALCGPCATAALWDLQAHSPQGGAGYYTSLRGGGPVTTLVLADDLWHTVWVNVVEQAALGIQGRPDPGTFFPWVNVHDRKVESTKEHPLHVFWNMPRRLLMGQHDTGVCGVCGIEALVYKTFYKCPGGLQYAETDWRHPLSPYVRLKSGGYAVRGTEGNLAGYRNWLGLLVDTPAGEGVPALVVRRWLERDVKGTSLRLWGYGYRCDMASVLEWCEGQMPIIQSNGHRKEIDRFVITLVTLAQRGEECLSDSLRGAAKSAGRSDLPTSDPALEFWRKTETLFHETLQQGITDPSKENLEKTVEAWSDLIRKVALHIYHARISFQRIPNQWTARYAHKLARRLSGRDPMTLKTRRFGDWRLSQA